MLKRQKVEDAIQVLPQPGLQAEETDVEVSRPNTMRRVPAGVFVGGTMTRVEKAPTHQAHLEKPVSLLKENHSPRVSSARTVIFRLRPAAQKPVCHHLTGRNIFCFGRQP